jgi:hypothetical protein
VPFLTPFFESETTAQHPQLLRAAAQPLRRNARRRTGKTATAGRRRERKRSDTNMMPRAARMRTVSASRKSSDESPSESSSAATLRARCGRPGGGGVLAAAGLVLCICAAVLCAGDPDLGLSVIGIGHKLVLGPAALLRAAFARPFCRLAALGLAALRTAVAQAASRVAPRRLGDTVFFLLLYLTLSFRTADGATAADGLAEIAEDRLRRGLQGAQMAGGRPPRAVEAELCTIVDVFSKLTGIKTNLDCQAGCAGGSGACPVDWYPSAADECSAACGEMFEPFVSAPASTPCTHQPLYSISTVVDASQVELCFSRDLERVEDRGLSA